MRTDRISFLDLRFDRLTLQQVKSRLASVTSGTPYGYIVTPNVDHIVRIDGEPKLRAVYEGAQLCVCDSRILRFLARVSGIRLPLVPGSDLAAVLFSQIIKPGDRVAILGGKDDAVQRLREAFPAVDFVHHEPPMGLLENAKARGSAAAFLASSKARFCVLAVGSPQQEIIAAEAGHSPGATGTALCIGAGLDFVTGRQKRAPRILQRLGLEWAYRLATNPRRLWRRYLVDDVKILPIYLRWRGARGWKLWVAATVAVTALTGVSIYAASLEVPRHDPLRVGQSLSDSRYSGSQLIALPPPNLLRPLSPEEATQENGERPFVNRLDTPASHFVLHTDTEDSSRALTCLAQAIYYEAAGEGVDGGRAVAQVILNRVRHPGYPSTVCGVVYEGADRPTGCQFSFTCDGSMQRLPVPWLWARSRQIAQQALAGRVFAPIGHATHYHADYVLPYWADSLDKSAQIGRHIFYRLRTALGDAAAFSQRYAGAEPQVREPGTAVVIPPAAMTEQLANALVGDSTPKAATDVEKASPQPSSPLAVDAERGTLLADADAKPPAAHGVKPNTECAATGERRQLAPIGANDVRVSSAASGC
ncbi:MAG: WecB/TagA/CpsF family glycosyltransferase [Sphingomicrobium sp.]